MHKLTDTGEGACFRGSMELIGPELDAANIDGEAAETQKYVRMMRK